MSTLESMDEITPRSVLRHRPIGDSKPPTGKRSVITTAAVPVVPRSSRLRSAVASPKGELESAPQKEGEEKAASEKQSPTKQHSGKLAAKPKGKSRPPSSQTRKLPQTPRPELFMRKKLAGFPAWAAHPLLYCGIGMLGMLLLWSVGGALYTWGIGVRDDLQYGHPRTFQTDAWVGHNEQGGTPSHFIAINMNRHIEIIELPGGDATHARIYPGPVLYGANDDLVPVTLRFVDVNNDHRPDMLVLFQSTRLVYINDQGSFRPLQPSERSVVEHALQQLQL